jgi:hypothetical protein
MIGRVPDATRSLRPRRKPGWWRWRARSPKRWVILTSCGPRGCSPRMPVNTHHRQHAPSAGHPSLGKLAQGTVCKILAEPEVKPHKSLPSRKRGCVTSWKSAIPSSSPRWLKFSVSTGKWRCCVGKREPARARAKRAMVTEASPSSLTTRNRDPGDCYHRAGSPAPSWHQPDGDARSRV